MGYYIHFKMVAANSLKCEVCTATVTLYSKFCATCGAKLTPSQLSTVFSHANVTKNGSLAVVFLVDLGTSLQEHKKWSISNPGKLRLNEDGTDVKAGKSRFVLVPNSKGKVKYVIFPSPSLHPVCSKNGNPLENG